MLKQFTGFKGLCAFAQIGEIQFVILAHNKRELDALWAHIMTEAGPLDPAGCKKAVLIEASLLEGRAPSPKPVAPITPDPIDV